MLWEAPDAIAAPKPWIPIDALRDSWEIPKPPKHGVGFMVAYPYIPYTPCQGTSNWGFLLLSRDPALYSNGAK